MRFHLIGLAAVAACSPGTPTVGPDASYDASVVTDATSDATNNPLDAGSDTSTDGGITVSGFVDPECTLPAEAGNDPCLKLFDAGVGCNGSGSISEHFGARSVTGQFCGDCTRQVAVLLS